jgi:hypothetical protein
MTINWVSAVRLTYHIWAGLLSLLRPRHPLEYCSTKVLPIVTAIIALPMSIPFPDAVIAPACDRPNFEEKRKKKSALSRKLVSVGTMGT